MSRAIAKDGGILEDPLFARELTFNLRHCHYSEKIEVNALIKELFSIVSTALSLVKRFDQVAHHYDRKSTKIADSLKILQKVLALFPRDDQLRKCMLR